MEYSVYPDQLASEASSSWSTLFLKSAINFENNYDGETKYGNVLFISFLNSFLTGYMQILLFKINPYFCPENVVCIYMLAHSAAYIQVHFRLDYFHGSKQYEP